MFKSSIKGGMWTIFRIILGIAALALFIYQIYFAGQWLLSNEHEGRRISSADYENLTNGEMVYGKIEVVSAFYGDISSNGVALNYYLVKTNNNKILVFRTESESICDVEFSKVLSGGSSRKYFIGYVKAITDVDRRSILIKTLADNKLRDMGIYDDFNKVCLNQVVDVSIYQEYSDESVFIASIVGGLLMLGLSILLLKKPVKNAVYSIGVAVGKIQPYVPELDLVQHDDEFKKYEEINPDNAEDIEYYEDYEKDSVDFNIEEDHRTIYDEEYIKPTLEKDIPIYDDYKYDSLDFAQEEIEKRDINEF